MANDNNNPDKDTRQHLGLKELTTLVLHNWKWVVLSLIVCIGLAVFYLKSTNPVYKREASVIVKDESDGLSLGGVPDLGMGDLGLFSGNSNFENELTTFRSPDYMEEVVERLGLQTSYSEKSGLRKPPLYGEDLPFTVDFMELTPEEGVYMKFRVLENEDIIIDPKMMVNGKKAEYTGGTVHFGKPFKTPAGTAIISKTPRWDKAPAAKHNTAPEDKDDEKERTFYVLRMSLEDATNKYCGALDVDKENDKGATVINLMVKDTSPQRATDILQTLIDVYNSRWEAEKVTLAENTSKFIEDRLQVLARELGDVDEAITDYKKRNLIIDPEIDGKVKIEKGAEVDRQRLEISNTLEISRYLKEFLAKEKNKFQTLPVNVGVGNPSLEKQISDYNGMVLHRNGIESNSSAANPVVASLDANIATMRRSLSAALDNQIVTLEKQLGSLNREMGANDARLASSPEQMEFLRAHGREQTVKEQLYLFLLQKREENEISRSFGSQNLKVIRRPGGDSAPFKPNTKLTLFMAFIFGLFIPTGVIYIRETSNTKLRSRKDIDNLQIPLLGEIPQLKKKMSKEAKNVGDNIVVGEGKRDISNEAFRVIRTNLGFLTANDPKGTVIMVTSFIQNSGKTFVTMNLAVACAMKKRVAVIDCDLRKRSASSYVGNPRQGLTDYLNGTVTDLDSVLVCDNLHANLCVLPAGTLPPNPTELLESPRFREAIEELRSKFDYIFIDCPPSEMMADAQIVDSVADRTIYILRAGNLDLSMLSLLKQYYDEKKYKNISLILNGLSEVQSRGYGNYGYGELEKELNGWNKLFKKSRNK